MSKSEPELDAGNAEFLSEVLKGLKSNPKTLPCKYFYDKKGSELFEKITRLPEYYLTRTEMKIMRENIYEIAEAVGPAAAIIEYGSGSSAKTEFLLERLNNPAVYVPIDIKD